MELSAISQQYELRCSPRFAFEIFTAHIGIWWDLGDDEFGRVTRFEPGEVFAMTSVLAQSPDAPSHITVSFAHGAASLGLLRAWRVVAGQRRVSVEVHTVARHTRPLRRPR